jgi:hypothetical protein
MCPDCYRYDLAVLFNACAGDLWRRFITYLPRHLARLAGITQKALFAQVRIRFVKVAEYQARGVVHFHAVIRLDANSEDYQPPADRYTADQLCDAISQAAAAVAVPVEHDGQVLTLTFGPQTDTRPVRRDTITATGQPLNVDAVANYIAKYVTKALDVPGLPDARIRHLVEVEALRCPAHHKRMVLTAWQLGGARRDARFRLHAHMLGWGGHPLTKSRRYSVTFGHLRGERREHRRLERYPDGERDSWGRPLDDTVVLILKTWTYAGTGYSTATAGAELALALADMARGR